ncbi:TOX high mobility group box family member 3-like [Maniola hyperantus]|uniref:TOX high mobility group box family member 3-like n=1 Tax=Aphantopus hyperantus TaxID=2795564 RepID=UPI003748CADE
MRHRAVQQKVQLQRREQLLRKEQQQRSTEQPLRKVLQQHSTEQLLRKVQRQHSTEQQVSKVLQQHMELKPQLVRPQQVHYSSLKCIASWMLLRRERAQQLMGQRQPQAERRRHKLPGR